MIIFGDGIVWKVFSFFGINVIFFICVKILFVLLISCVFLAVCVDLLECLFIWEKLVYRLSVYQQKVKTGY